MVVVIEGIDGVGKTTLCEALKKVLNNETFGADILYHKESAPGKSIVERFKRLATYDCCVNDNRIHIYDRATIIDDFVYEPLFNECESCFSISPLCVLCISEMLRRSLIIHLTAPVPLIEERLSQRGDRYVTKSDIHAIRKLYNTFYERMQLRPRYVDSTDTDTAVQFCTELISLYVKGVRNEN